jgi:hypothetical protein
LQLAASVCVFTLQPWALTPSQLAKPALQLSEQSPKVQTGVAFSVPQTKPQEPQLFTSTLPLISQPVIEFVQSRYPALQLYAQVPEQ